MYDPLPCGCKTHKDSGTLHPRYECEEHGPFETSDQCPDCGQLATGPNHSVPGTEQRCGWWWDNSKDGQWLYYPPKGIA